MSGHNAQGDADTSHLQMIATVGADQAKGGLAGSLVVVAWQLHKQILQGKFILNHKTGLWTLTISGMYVAVQSVIVTSSLSCCCDNKEDLTTGRFYK